MTICDRSKLRADIVKMLDERDVLGKLDDLVNDYETYQTAVKANKMESIVDQYIALIKEVVG